MHSGGAVDATSTFDVQIASVDRDRAIVAAIESWFSSNARDFPWRRGRLPDWKILVTEILLQQTQADRVARFVETFFKTYPGPEHIVRKTERELARSLIPMGLHNRRAKRLRALAAEVLRRGGSIPDARADLEALPGVGPYVAAAFMSIARGAAEPTVDVNMARVVERLYGPRRLVDIRYDPHINETAKRLVRLASNARRFNWAILDLAAKHCRARRRSCSSCPLQDLCPSAGERLVRAGSSKMP